MVTPERLAEFYEAERLGQPVDRAAFTAALEEFQREHPGDPVTHLCNHILREGIFRGWRQVKLVRADASAALMVRAHLDGSWRDVMDLPAPMRVPLVRRFLAMAHLERSGEAADCDGELQVTVEGTIHRLQLTLHGAPGEAEELIISFAVPS